ncbi:MAG: hypothetical protein QXJ06_03145 [Candidatus Aenigmatarchaeota archaeon]
MIIGKIGKFFKTISESNAVFNIIAILLSLVSLFIALGSLLISKKVYTLTSLDYIPIIEFQVTGDPSYCSWPEIIDRQIIVVNKTNDVYKIDSITFIGVEGVGFEDYISRKIVEIPLVHIYDYKDFWYSNASNGRIVFNFKDSYVSEDREYIYQKIKEKIESEYGYDNEPNPIGAALPYLKTCYYYINIEYEDKSENIKNIYYKYYHIHGLGYRKKRITENEYSNFLEKFEKIPFECDFNTIWNYLIKEYSQPFPP